MEMSTLALPVPPLRIPACSPPTASAPIRVSPRDRISPRDASLVGKTYLLKARGVEGGGGRGRGHSPPVIHEDGGGVGRGVAPAAVREGQRATLPRKVVAIRSSWLPKSATISNTPAVAPDTSEIDSGTSAHERAGDQQRRHQDALLRSRDLNTGDQVVELDGVVPVVAEVDGRDAGRDAAASWDLGGQPGEASGDKGGVQLPTLSSVFGQSLALRAATRAGNEMVPAATGGVVSEGAGGGSAPDASLAAAGEDVLDRVADSEGASAAMAGRDLAVVPSMPPPEEQEEKGAPESSTSSTPRAATAATALEVDPAAPDDARERVEPAHTFSEEVASGDEQVEAANIFSEALSANEKVEALSANEAEAAPASPAPATPESRASRSAPEPAASHSAPGEPATLALPGGADGEAHAASPDHGREAGGGDAGGEDAGARQLEEGGESEGGERVRVPPGDFATASYDALPGTAPPEERFGAPVSVAGAVWEREREGGMEREREGGMEREREGGMEREREGGMQSDTSPSSPASVGERGAWQAKRTAWVKVDAPGT
ncbi:hypothetical protein T484DRAFT_1810497 [Baffinella frigidus]|nr:hypothetical protein T484DRAFT_1810497 [Cryptophyta sp. CCMP2293]